MPTTCNWQKLDLYYVRGRLTKKDIRDQNIDLL